MVRNLNGGHGMKNMGKSGTGSDLKSERILNPTEFTKKALIT